MIGCSNLAFPALNAVMEQNISFLSTQALGQSIKGPPKSVTCSVVAEARYNMSSYSQR